MAADDYADDTTFNTPIDDNDLTQPPLEEDNDAPASPARVPGSKIAPDHPSGDTNMDAHEMYDEGFIGASEIESLKEEATDEDYI